MSLRSGRWAIAILSLPILLFLAGFALHPFLAVTKPSGSDIAVVEGWIPADVMPQVKKEIEKRGYTRIYTTGTIRPFAYWLKNGEKITVEFTDPIGGGVEIKAAGLPGAHLQGCAGRDTLIVTQISSELNTFWVDLAEPVSELTLQPVNVTEPSDVEVLFLQQLKIRGDDAHAIAKLITIEHADGSIGPGWPTHAHYAEKLLVDLGIDEMKITIVPVMEAIEGRTRGNAKAFAEKIGSEPIRSVDVISIGVHARRSMNEFQKACGDKVEVGVIAIDDPEVPAGSWWRTKAGWLKMLKEVAGLAR